MRNGTVQGLLELQEMLDYQDEGIDRVRCPVCRQFHLINQRMTTAAPKPPIETVLIELKQGQSEIRKGQEDGFASVRTDLKKLISQADEQYAALMTVLTDVAKDGPRLFSFHPVETGFFDKPKWVDEKFRLTLWCEHARLPQPALTGDKSSGVYEVELTRDWLTKSAPFLKILSGTLSLTLPIASSGIKMATPDFEAIEGELNFGRSVAQSLGKSTEMLADWITGSDDTELESTRVIMAQGSMLRELHGLLKAKDPNGKFGGLERVQNKRREFLWVHPQFVSEY